jgi:hypothetical protein
MDGNPFSSPGMKWNTNSNDTRTSKTVRAQQQLALTPSATEQTSHSSTAKTLEISKTQDCHATIQALMQPFISTCDEGKIRCVAVLMEEIANIMQERVCGRCSSLSLSRIETPDSQQKMPAPELPSQASIVSVDDTSISSRGGNQSQRELPSAVAFADTPTKQVSFAQSPQSSPHHTVQTQPLIAPASDMVRW